MKNTMNQEEILSIFKKYNIKPIKKLGQNFLIDENILKTIISAAELNSDDIVLEIGPGLGILTMELAKKAKKVIAVEKDRKMCEALKNALIANKINNVEIINEDVLRVSEPTLNYKIVANIPYYLTSPLIRKFLEAKNKPESIILTIQKEVAQRIVAQPPKMSLLSVAVQFYGEPKIIDYVSKNSFYPAPKVDSAIIKIIPKQIPDIDTKKFFAIVKKGFSSKRKMLKNNLLSINLEKIGLNPKSRAENLSIEDWLKIFAYAKNIF